MCVECGGREPTWWDDGDGRCIPCLEGRVGTCHFCHRTQQPLTRAAGPSCCLSCYKRASKVPDRLRRLVLAEGPCVYCGATATRADHVRPAINGGPTTFGNLVPACATCNQDKYLYSLAEWNQHETIRLNEWKHHGCRRKGRPRFNRVEHGRATSATVATEWERAIETAERGDSSAPRTSAIERGIERNPRSDGLSR
ncbi:HNH endonuclease [Nocardia noduli]|uniref:HNH endonuclease n=1 Tax=Nocardia noduli TaxID=2815722 RepID=UPI0034D489B9